MSTFEKYLLSLGSAALIAFLTNLNELNGDEWAQWSWVGWSRFWGSITLQVFVAWKSLTTILPPSPPSIQPPEKPKE
jgi:hypothetical protein